MSVATPFKAHGKGNGFGFCPTTIDVVEFDDENQAEVAEYYAQYGITITTYWTTLGGYNKVAFDAGTPVTDAQIELSFQNAMKLFWNLENVTGDAHHTYHGALVSAVPITSGDPKDRVCRTGIGGSVDHQPIKANAGMAASIAIARMVDGDTLLGYGIHAYPLTLSGLLATNGIHAYLDYYFAPAKLHVALWSMASDWDGGFIQQSFAYVEKNGMHFVGYAAGDGGSRDATVPMSDSYDTVADGGVRIDELEFFTYP
tara:strand:- start:351 stop:1121 length:771 start_codon:yes stop_codon:yes gene_type:complete